MEYTTKKSSGFSWRRIAYPTLITILIIAGTLIALELTNKTNFFSNPPVVTEQTRPVNDVDYSPATPTDNVNSDKIKQNSLNDTPQTKPLNVVLTRVTQAIDTKALIIRALVEGTDSGTCTLELIQNEGNPQYTAQAPVIQQNNVFTCSGFDIAQADLPGLGEWTIKLAVSSGSSTTTAQQNIVLIK